MQQTNSPVSVDALLASLEEIIVTDVLYDTTAYVRDTPHDIMPWVVSVLAARADRIVQYAETPRDHLAVQMTLDAMAALYRELHPIGH